MLLMELKTNKLIFYELGNIFYKNYIIISLACSENIVSRNKWEWYLAMLRAVKFTFSLIKIFNFKFKNINYINN